MLIHKKFRVKTWVTFICVPKTNTSFYLISFKTLPQSSCFASVHEPHSLLIGWSSCLVLQPPRRKKDDVIPTLILCLTCSSSPVWSPDSLLAWWALPLAGFPDLWRGWCLGECPSPTPCPPVPIHHRPPPPTSPPSMETPWESTWLSRRTTAVAEQGGKTGR